MKPKRILLTVILLILVIFSFTSCTKKESMKIKPKFENIKELTIEITDEYERFEVTGVNVKSTSESTIDISVIETKDNKTLLRSIIRDYEVKSNFRGRKDVPEYKSLQNVEFDFTVDRGNIILESVDTSKSEKNNISEEFIKKALEQTFTILLKGYANKEMKLKDYWKTNIKMPIIMQSDPDAYVSYSLTYQLDRVDQTGVIDLLLDGTAEIISQKVKKSYGKVKGLIKFDLIKGFPVKVEFAENFELEPANEELSPIVFEKKKTFEIEIK